jgi:undecaprenyl-diphosphatase
VLFVGLAQALALVPGVSRSGVTITAARAAGIPRIPAARLSFLLATPITMAALVGGTGHLSSGIPVSHLVAGVLSSALVGLFAIHGLLRWLNRAGFGLFFAYRAALAAVLVITLLRR